MAALCCGPDHFVHPVSLLPACLSSSKDHRDPGGWAGLASRHWAVGRWAKQDRFLSSASALDLGLGLGLLCLLACCDPAPACSLPGATSGQNWVSWTAPASAAN